MKRISWVLPCLFLAACGLTAKEVRDHFNPYLGQHYDSIITDLGPPTSCAGLSTGEKVCEWDKSYNSYYQGSGGTVEKRYRFVITKEGVVTEWRWDGPIRPFLRWSYVKLSSKDSP